MSREILIDLIAGARPNFMKIAPVIEALEAARAAGSPLRYRLIHTGQHYDRNMSGTFFEQLGIPLPHVNLEVGSGTQAEQTAAIMVRYEKTLLELRSRLCVVFGDVTSTMACAIVAKKLNIQVAHVEAGIRSGDWSMPEEINRIVTDSVSDHYFTTSRAATDMLRRSGVAARRIFFVGNTMIDTLLKHRARFRPPECWNTAGLRDREYFVLTLHRPANVDDAATLEKLLNTILRCAGDLPVVFPVHPRTAKSLKGVNLRGGKLITTEPMPYLEFNYLVERARAVITDSGGVSEETTVLGVPCMTLRTTTERPETVQLGTNVLLGTDAASLPPAFKRLLAGKWRKGVVPPRWDGKTGRRIVARLERLFQESN